ncbi:hypothetical protein SISSUDRAFT_1121294 [Sistotremastrum suecicum HHB10207 ss-3]|uniref:Uncharacterized protein n=1 Tax=Sistotremastrum suecicum HHB10207 ss-3 TaxID=1314776 RepID=A0A166B2D1_9AGAM|nr:hypothetical protein SISSUDRAFT_1121294 [Sistotremastrum suecicum HHB10207 ss-3]
MKPKSLGKGNATNGAAKGLRKGLRSGGPVAVDQEERTLPSDVKNDVAGLEKENQEESDEENNEADPDFDDCTDDEALEEVTNPSKDIRAALKAALTTKPSAGTYAFSKTVYDAPMPGLNIAGLGNISVPLNERSARELVGVCALVPSAKGNTWELAGGNVTFSNPRWHTWFKTTLTPEVNRFLGVTCGSTFELEKIVVYGKGAHGISDQETVRSKAAFARVIIVLPSPFEGGQLHMSHSGQFKILDVAKGSDFGTSILAWYADVRGKSRPISRGYQLALVYNLFSLPGAPRPQFPECSLIVSAVRHALLSWGQSQDRSTPDKLAFVLDNKYAELGNGTESLQPEGSDLRTMDILQSLVKKCRFRAYLATAGLNVIGEAVGYREYCRDNYHMGRVDDFCLLINNITDLEGRVIKSADLVDFEHPDDFIPRPLDKGELDYERYDREGGTMENQYSATVILLWPENRSAKVVGAKWLEEPTARSGSTKHQSHKSPPRPKAVNNSSVEVPCSGAVAAPANHPVSKRAMPSSSTSKPVPRKRSKTTSTEVVDLSSMSAAEDQAASVPALEHSVANEVDKPLASPPTEPILDPPATTLPAGSDSQQAPANLPEPAVTQVDAVEAAEIKPHDVEEVHEEIRSKEGDVDLDEDSDSDDSEYEDDEDQYEKILNPSEDIETDLMAAFDMDVSQYKGNLAFSHTFSAAPLPGLTVAGLGELAFPLSPRSAQDLVNTCQWFASGKDAQTTSVAEHMARDTWELTPDEVWLQNPSWDEWFKSSVLPVVSQNLGVRSFTSWTFKRLVCGKYIPHSSSQSQTPGSVIAEVLVVLPSPFTDGRLQVSHDGRSQILDVANSSTYNTSVIGWYTGLQHQAQPVESGLRLALAFDLTAPIGTPRPAISGFDPKASVIRHVLLSWRQSFAEGIPNHIAYVLDGHSSEDRARTSSTLAQLAEELRFKVYFGTATLHVRGDVDENEYSDSGWDEDAMKDITDSHLRLEDFADDDGNEPDFDLNDLKLDTEDFLPSGLDEEGKRPDEEKFNPAWYSDDGSLERWYSWDVVMLWPENRDEAVQGRDWFKEAAKKLKRSESPAMTDEEAKIIRRMRFHFEGGQRSDIASLQVCRSALRWQDYELCLWGTQIGDFAAVVSTPSGFKCERLSEAACVFGFERVKSVLNDVLTKCLSITYRFNLIRALSQSPIGKSPEVTSWCEAQREEAARTLKTPTPADVECLLAIGWLKGADYIRNVMLPQLKSLKSPRAFWFAFLEGLRADKSHLAPSAEFHNDVIKATLAALLDQLEPFSTKDNNPYKYDPDATIQLVRTCLSLNSPESCGSIFEKMAQRYEKLDRGTQIKLLSEVYEPLIVALDSFHDPPHSLDLAVDPFASFLRTTVVRLVDRIVEEHSPDWKAAINAVKRFKHEGVKILEDKIISFINGYRSTPSTSATLAQLLTDSWKVDPESEEGVAVKALVTSLVTLSISKANILFQHPNPDPYARFVTVYDNLEEAKKLLLLCFSTESVALIPSILSRTKAPMKDVNGHFLKVTLPFIPVLSKVLAEHNISISAEPYGAFCRKVLVKYVDCFVKPRPSNNLQVLHGNLAVLACSAQCSLCAQLMKSLAAPERIVIIPQRNDKDRKHLEGRIRSRLGLNFRVVREKKPYALEITKPDSLIGIGSWNERRQAALIALTSLGSPQNIQDILRDDCDRIAAILNPQSSCGAISTAPTQAITAAVITSPAPVVDAPRPASSALVLQPVSQNVKRTNPADSSADEISRKRSRLVSGATMDLCTPSP